MIQRPICLWRLIPRRLCSGVVTLGVILVAASCGESRAAYIYDPSGGIAGQDSAASGDGIAEVDKAFACFERGEVPQCLDFLRLARKGNPDVLPAEVILAELYLRENQVARPARCWNRRPPPSRDARRRTSCLPGLPWRRPA